MSLSSVQKLCKEASLSDSSVQRASMETSFSWCLNHVKMFLRNSMTQERFSVGLLHYVSVEKGILMKLQTESTHMAWGINWLICKEKRLTSDFAVQIIIWVSIFYIYMWYNPSSHCGLPKFRTHHPSLLKTCMHSCTIVWLNMHNETEK